jgi:hypothetical protein
MSENEVKEDDNNALQEVSRKIVITPEDCSGAADFWPHFEVLMTPELKDAFEAFTKDPNLDNQDAIKLAITKAIAYTEHEAFKDEMFKEIRKECEDVVFDMSFDKDLEKTLNAAPAEDKKDK